MKINIFGMAKESFVDGEGVRYAIFAQGCTHGCIGCHNPNSHSFNKNIEIEVEELLKDIKSKGYLDGVTFSGGDPMFQAKAFNELAKRIKGETNLSIWCYTGYTFEEVRQKPQAEFVELLENIDVLIDGKFELDNKNLSLLFRGSSNQRLIDVPKSLKAGKVVEWER